MGKSNTITVGHTVELNIVLFNSEPTLTFSMIDSAHGRPEGTAKARFSQSKERFTEGKHYHMVKHAEADQLAPYGVNVPPRGLTLITKRGYLLLVKSFTDDLAWQVQEQLVDYYFEGHAAPNADEVQTISATQLKSLRDAMINCTRYLRHQNSSLSSTLYLQMKAELGYQQIERMPADQFDDATLWIKQREPICRKVWEMTTFVEREFMKGIKAKNYTAAEAVPAGILTAFNSQAALQG